MAKDTVIYNHDGLKFQLMIGNMGSTLSWS